MLTGNKPCHGNDCPYNPVHTTIEEVKSFISQFEPVKDFFISGKCFFFAEILKNRFNGKILYLPITGHFVCMIDDEYYDATGYLGGYDSLGEPCYLWDTYGLADPAHHKRLLRDCVYLLKEED